jgi:hypothetical protein
MWLIIVGILFVSGILYYVFARSMPPIVLGITIVCGAIFLFYIIRFIREKLRYRESVGYVGYDKILGDTLKQAHEQAHADTYGSLYPEPKLDHTETVPCLEKEGEVHTAVVEYYEDGTRKVRCRGDCSDCPYGYVEQL